MGLPLEPDGKNLHRDRSPTQLSKERYPHVPPGGSRFDLPPHLQNPCWQKLGKRQATNVFGRLSLDKPADTVRTTFLKPETGRYIHPVADRGLNTVSACLSTRIGGSAPSHRVGQAEHQCTGPCSQDIIYLILSPSH